MFSERENISVRDKKFLISILNRIMIISAVAWDECFAWYFIKKLWNFFLFHSLGLSTKEMEDDDVEGLEKLLIRFLSLIISSRGSKCVFR